MSTRLSLPLVLEYPDGRWRNGDVDSGPLVAEASLSATVVTMGAARVSGDVHPADQIHHAVWSKAATPWLEDVAAVTRQPAVPAWWRLPWSLAGGLVVVAGGSVVATGRLLRPRTRCEDAARTPRR